MKEILDRGKIPPRAIGISDEVYTRLRNEVAKGVFNGLLYFFWVMILGMYMVGFMRGLLE
ncbi:MAG: hypothetical protein IJ184_07405 [Alphaproteobacteria bacterium]|nr:hypothetical protein [Alphaproteobacteria bacterium]